MRPRLSLESKQVMTFSLHQALQILQMPQLELAAWIRAEIERNPLLEETDSPRSVSSAVSFSMPDIAAPSSLRDHLLQQARESFICESDFELAVRIIDQLDEKGWVSLDDQSPDVQQIEGVLSVIQTFHPPGIAARNLRESLLLQLRETSHSLAFRLIENHFDGLLHGRFARVQREMNISSEEFQKALQRIARLKAHAADPFQNTASPNLIPDLSLQEIEQGWFLEICEDELPSFSLRHDYLKLYPDLPKGGEKETMRGWITSAKWLQRCIKRRRETIRQIGRFLIRRQRAFLSGQGEIVPLSLAELATHLHIHESTASRAVSDKVLSCPHGLIPFRRFFSPALNKNVSSEGFKEILQRLVADEDKTKPLTDAEIVERLRDQKITCARRTVAKYRQLLNIGSAAQRKAFG